MQFNVDTNAVIKFTNELEKLNHSAFPNAVRGTLNGLALDVKKRTMPLMVEKEFTQRRKTFFKANSRVEFARGFNLNTMQSEVGFIDYKAKGNRKAIDELEQQEHGGKIKDRELIPLDKARISGSRAKNVRTKNRLKGKTIIKVSGQPGRNYKHKFHNAIIRAGIGGYIQGTKVVSRVKNIQKVRNGRFRWKFDLENLYFVNNKKTIDIEKTNFMRKASEMSLKKGNEIYFKEAERQFDRHFSKKY